MTPGGAFDLEGSGGYSPLERRWKAFGERHRREIMRKGHGGVLSELLDRAGRQSGDELTGEDEVQNEQGQRGDG
jgi:hypothetical protein